MHRYTHTHTTHIVCINYLFWKIIEFCFYRCIDFRVKSIGTDSVCCMLHKSKREPLNFYSQCNNEFLFFFIAKCTILVLEKRGEREIIWFYSYVFMWLVSVYGWFGVRLSEDYCFNFVKFHLWSQKKTKYHWPDQVNWPSIKLPHSKKCITLVLMNFWTIFWYTNR